MSDVVGQVISDIISKSMKNIKSFFHTLWLYIKSDGYAYFEKSCSICQKVIWINSVPHPHWAHKDSLICHARCAVDEAATLRKHEQERLAIVERAKARMAAKI